MKTSALTKRQTATPTSEAKPHSFHDFRCTYGEAACHENPPVGGRSADRVFFIIPQRLARVGFAMERLL